MEKSENKKIPQDLAAFIQYIKSLSTAEQSGLLEITNGLVVLAEEKRKKTVNRRLRP